MPNSIEKNPEVAALNQASQFVRIPQEIDVPLTDRVRSLIDSKAFQRLRNISQLGLVGMVYPGATHSRFEHCLGVYRNCLLVLNHFRHDERFNSYVNSNDVTCLIVASLLHDLGHWPFCHPIEDLSLESVCPHEKLAAQYLNEDEIARILRKQWDLEPEAVASLLFGKRKDETGRLLQSILSGPIDIDKLDYLYRDSLHAGVPYGMNFDKARLIGSLCLNECGDGIAITEKGRTAAELLVFARYVMFSEVYWHHTVRSATAMLQRIFFETQKTEELKPLFRLDEQTWIAKFAALSADKPWSGLADQLFGTRRILLKRLGQYTSFDGTRVFDKLARRPFHSLVKCSNRLADLIGEKFNQKISPFQVLIDAPPIGLEVQFKVEVFYPKENRYRSLGEVSPVTQTLATNQFDDIVKRVRVFADREVSTKALSKDELIEMLLQAAE
jgi:HD superfamily phosphohydrolase